MTGSVVAADSPGLRQCVLRLSYSSSRSGTSSSGFVDAVDSDSLFYGISDPNVYRTLVPFLTPLFVLILLIATRRYFDVAAPAKTYRRLGAAIVTLLAVLAVIYVGGGMLARHGFDREPTVTMLLADFPQRLVPPVYLQLIDPRLLPVDIESTLLFEWTGVVFWGVAAVLVFVSFLKPVKTADPKAAERARSHVDRRYRQPLVLDDDVEGKHILVQRGTVRVTSRIASSPVLLSQPAIRSVLQIACARRSRSLPSSRRRTVGFPASIQ